MHFEEEEALQEELAPQMMLHELDADERNFLAAMVEPPDDEKSNYYCVEYGIDSMAARHVDNVSRHPGATLMPPKSTDKDFITASGEVVKHKGTFQLEGKSVEGHKRTFTFVHAEVIKGLLSTGQMAKGGYASVLKDENSYIMDSARGDKFKVRTRGNCYFMNLWFRKTTKPQVFSRP